MVYEELIFPKPSSSLTGSSPKCRNCITNVNLSLVIIDLKSLFYPINPKTNKTCMLAWQQVPDFCDNFLFLLKGWEEFITFWAYAFDLVTSPFKGWSIANELEKNNRLSSAGTSIFIPSFWLNSNMYKTGSALDQLLFELPLLSSPSLELSSAKLLLSVVSEPWFTGFLSSALDGLSVGRLLLRNRTLIYWVFFLCIRTVRFTTGFILKVIAFVFPTMCSNSSLNNHI